MSPTNATAILAAMDDGDVTLAISKSRAAHIAGDEVANLAHDADVVSLSPTNTLLGTAMAAANSADEGGDRPAEDDYHVVHISVAKVAIIITFRKPIADQSDLPATLNQPLSSAKRDDEDGTAKATHLLTKYMTGELNLGKGSHADSNIINNKESEWGSIIEYDLQRLIRFRIRIRDPEGRWIPSVPDTAKGRRGNLPNKCLSLGCSKLMWILILISCIYVYMHS
ncbi:hypothetical protein L7F22_028761 [Adiantum nelumboides]|nr:hypothetical protein [Adiantum nelumboides]